MRQVEQYEVSIIEALKRRPLNEDSVLRLTESIKSIGLRTPITVRILDDFMCADGEVADGVPVLVTGAHRLEAVERLGWKEIECFLFTDSSEFGDDEITAKLWEISENLHRAELTTLERSEQIAEWVRLTEEREKVAQVAQVSPEPHKGGRGNTGGVSAASRELGIDRDKVRRAVKIASIPEEAKEAAAAAGLSDNQSALERVAKADDAVAEVGRIVEEREARKAPEPETRWTGQDESTYAALLDAWEGATQGARDSFRRWVRHAD